MDATLIAPTPPYSALIFDCDGTLADTLPVHFQTWSASLKAVGADISKEWYYQYCGTSAKEMLQPPIPHPQLSHALFGVGEGASIPKILSKNTQD
jgi:phosphoglycolate phosphatase-like HAD superfamily hydrolase